MVPKRVSIAALLVGCCLAVLAAVISGIPVAWSVQEGLDLYALFWVRGARPAPSDVILVPIDELARRRLFLPQVPEDFERCRDVLLDKALPGYKNPDPPHVLTRWPRCLHGRALDALARTEPAAIVMDISFRPRNDPSGTYREQDRALAASIRNAGRVLLALHISTHQDTDDQAQPVAGEIEEAALALAPFLVLGEEQARADKFCTFKEEDRGWSGPCLPTVAHQVASLKVYPQFRAMLEHSAPRNVDLLPQRAETLLAERPLQAPVRLIRHLAMSDERAAERMREVLASTHSAIGVDERQLHNLTDIYLGPAIRYFNFYGPPGTFRIMRYETLVAGNESARPGAGSLRGKVVFIGFAQQHARETSEHFNTPFTEKERGIKLSGVELAATAYANLKDGSAIVPVSPGWRALIALSFGVLFTLASVALFPKGIWLGVLGIAALGCGYFAVAWFAFDRFALWLPVSPLGLDAFGGFAAGFVELQRRRAEFQRAYEALRQLLPAEVVERIVSQNKKLADLRHVVVGTCVMTDLQGYTALFRTRTSDEVARILDCYFDALFPEVKRQGGNPIDVIGDAMLAVWHAPRPEPAVREKACIAALQLAEAAERFRDPASSEPFHTRIGVEYGEMTMGMVGAASSHLEYRPVGMPVNTASRLQELCGPLGTRVLVTGSVIAGLGGFLARDLGHFRLRHVPDLVHVYELIAELAHATPGQLELCAKFAQALTLYQSGRLGEARVLFSELPKDDGPARFYAEQCAAGRHLERGVIEQEKIDSERKLPG